jgi:Holliday junction resolvase RusA-like endonuclease
MRLTLFAIPPATNNLYTVVRGRAVLSEAGRAAKAAWAEAFRAVRGARAPHAGPVAVLIVYRLGATDRDVDGSHKAIIDAGSGVLYEDDRQIVLFAARKERAPVGVLPSTTVVVRELAASPHFRMPVSPPHSRGFATNHIGPTTNNAYAPIRGIRRKTAEARVSSARYEAAAREAAGEMPPLTGPLRLRVRHGYQADRRDVDGSHKLVVDACRGLLFLDDRQVRSFSVAKGRVAAGDESIVVIDVHPLDGAA